VFQAALDARESAPAMDLRISGQAGANGVPQVIIFVIAPEFGDELRPLRPWPDETHVASNHVPKLRKLIEAVTPQEQSGPGAPRIVWNGPDRSEVFFSIDRHGAELENREAAAANAYADLTVKYRSAVTEPDRRPDDRKNRRQQNQTKRGAANVDASLEDGLPAVNGLMRVEPPVYRA
jgi:hypothetical protein